MFTDSIATIVGRIRLEIGDQTEGKGVRPNGANFSDDELTLFYTTEGGDDEADPVTSFVGRAAAKACEVLSVLYASEPTSTRMGPSGDTMKASELYAKMATRLRSEHGRALPRQSRRLPSGSATVDFMPAGATTS